MQMLTKIVTIQKYNYWKIVSVGVTVSNYVKKVQRMQAATWNVWASIEVIYVKLRCGTAHPVYNQSLCIITMMKIKTSLPQY